MPDRIHGSRSRIVVAGSGLAGLSCALELAGSAEVTLFERLPVIAGENWEEPKHSALVDHVAAAEVHCAPGTQVVRWSSGLAVAVGTSGGLYEADALVVATGHRPRNRAELDINGTRCGGVIAATVAEHLQAQGIRLGSNVIVAGGGRRARKIAEAVIREGSCTIIGSAEIDLPGTIATLPDARVTRTVGMPRITAVEIREGESSWLQRCDSLVLADETLPYRNIDGAVLPAPGVVFAQRDDRDGSFNWDPIAAGRHAAAEALSICTEAVLHRNPVKPRIGAPR